MNTFKRNLLGYTLFEVMITISISAFFLTFCYEVHRRHLKKSLFEKHHLRAKKECLDFFTKVAPFIYMSTQFTQKNTATMVLKLPPIEENNLERHLEIRLNGKQRSKDTLNMLTKHIREFSWAYWDSTKKQWVTFENEKPYATLSFIKATLWDKNKNPMDSFVFSCQMNLE